MLLTPQQQLMPMRAAVSVVTRRLFVMSGPRHASLLTCARQEGRTATLTWPGRPIKGVRQPGVTGHRETSADSNNWMQGKAHPAAPVTRSSAIAEGPRDASCQLKSCQLPRNSAETTYTTSPHQIDDMKLEISSEAKRDRQCALNHDAIESAPIVSSVIDKPTTLSCVYHLSTNDLLWRNFLSPQCRNCSRDPDHAHLGSTHSSQD